MDSEVEIFLHNLKYLRKHYSLSKERMSEIIDISIDDIDMIEQGKLPIELTISVVSNVHKYFGIPPKKQFTKRLDE